MCSRPVPGLASSANVDAGGLTSPLIAKPAPVAPAIGFEQKKTPDLWAGG